MKVLLINGSPRKNGCTYTALCEIEKELKRENIETEIFHVGTEPIRGCIACGHCKKSGTSRCVFNDDTVNTAIEKAINSDGIIVGSPVYYAGPSGQITSFLNRLFCAAGHSLTLKPASSIVSCRRGGATSTFDSLNKYFSISSMPIISSQYWNMVHGNTPDEVKQDLEGLQTMRTLGKNMAYFLKCIEAGKNSGVTTPIKESKIATNFIR